MLSVKGLAGEYTYNEKTSIDAINKRNNEIIQIISEIKVKKQAKKTM